MKSIALFLFILNAACSFSQEYQYRFKVQDVETYPASKELISIIRNKYNTESDPKHVMVRFETNTQEFQVISHTPLNQEEIAALMNEYSYTVFAFRNILIPISENEEE